MTVNQRVATGSPVRFESSGSPPDFESKALEKSKAFLFLNQFD